MLHHPDENVRSLFAAAIILGGPILVGLLVWVSEWF
jgi:hypothetical protein